MGEKNLVKKSIKNKIILIFVASVLITTVISGILSTIMIKRISEDAMTDYKETMISVFETEIRAEIQSARSVIQEYYDLFAAGEMDEEAAKLGAKESIRGMKYGDNGEGRFWIYSTDGTSVMNAVLPEIEGTRDTNQTDLNGVNLFNTISSGVSTEQYYICEFCLAGDDGVTPQNVYMCSALMPEWGWIVSTEVAVTGIEEAIVREEQENKKETATLNGINLVCMLALVVVFVVVGVRFSKGICDPLLKLSQISRELAEGKVGQQLERENGGNEVAVLHNSFCDMVENLKEQARIIDKIAEGDLTVKYQPNSEEDVVGVAIAKLIKDNRATFKTIEDAASDIQMGSSQIASASQSLAQGSTEQASAIEQVTVAVSEIADKSKINADNVNEVGRIIKETEENASDGNEKMHQMVIAMKDISESSINIKNVIKVIDDIAFNTNILALNAAVEASRAGEQGKGFAVVAEEVRNLAAKSAEAAKHTSDMVEDTIEKVQKGEILVHDTEEALQNINNSIQKIEKLSQQVESASNEQAEGAAQIDEALTQIASVVETNSAASEQCAASSAELSDQARRLYSEMERFKL